MFSDRLKQLRKECGITQVQFAQEFNVSKGTIGMWEIGKREPDFGTVARIADFFHVSVDYLIGRTEEKEKPTPVSEDGLTDDQQYLIDAIYNMNPKNINKLRIIVDQVISEREK